MPRIRIIVGILFFLSVAFVAKAEQAGDLSAFSGYDLRVQADSITTQQLEGVQLVFLEGKFSMSIGNSQYRSDSAIIVIKTKTTEYLGRSTIVYDTKVYLEGHIKSPNADHIPNIDITSKPVYQGSGIVLRFPVTGQIYATANTQKTGAVDAMPFYQKALAGLSEVSQDRLLTVIQRGAEIPKPERIVGPDSVKILASPEPTKGESKAVAKPKEPQYRYPVNISSASAEPIKIDSQRLQTEDGLSAAVITGRFYLWQKLEDNAGQLELIADNAVVYYAGNDVKIGSETGNENLQATGPIHCIYLGGNVEMTEGGRTIKADELYYDFNLRQGLGLNAEMRTFDDDRGLPIYIRADRIRQIAKDQFSGENITVTTSEFHQPQIKLTAKEMKLTDTTAADAAQNKVSESSYQLTVSKVKLFYGNVPFFYWPKVTSNVAVPQLPIKSIQVSNDNDFGTSVETRWHLFRMLGMKDPNGISSDFMVDYYGDRGVGVGIETEYEGEDYFGQSIGYIIDDRGEDDLGRTRENIEPESDVRGRFQWQHRQYFDDGWEMTAEASYLSDRNFLESYYRNDFNTGKEQENILQLKRTWDNQAFSVLGKVRVNDFLDTLEELPTVEHHLTGQSLFDDHATFFLDSQISRYRNRYDEDSAAYIDPAISKDFFTFGTTRAELDVPLNVNRTKIVPYAAGTFGFEDGSGFNTDLGGATEDGENDVAIGEAGLRISKEIWGVDPTFQSDFWNVNGIRHVVRPHAEFAAFAETDEQAEQRDMINLGLAQRWQTKRFYNGQSETIDWMKFNVDATFVTDDTDEITAPDRFIWSKAYQPLFFRRNSDEYGIRRDKINADHMWQVTDTTALLSDMNYDIEAGTVDQIDIGVSHFRSPDLSYYLGSRYLKNVEVLDEKGSHSVLFAITYKLDQRYTVIFSQEYNFDYGKSIENELSLIRKYHRVYWAFTLSSDSTLDRTGIMFSIWPEGLKEMTFGSRKYYGLTGTTSKY